MSQEGFQGGRRVSERFSGRVLGRIDDAGGAWRGTTHARKERGKGPREGMRRTCMQASLMCAHVRPCVHACMSAWWWLRNWRCCFVSSVHVRPAGLNHNAIITATINTRMLGRIPPSFPPSSSTLPPSHRAVESPSHRCGPPLPCQRPLPLTALWAPSPSLSPRCGLPPSPQPPSPSHRAVGPVDDGRQ
jgi:hypothetical protein